MTNETQEAIYAQKTVGEIAASDYRATQVFEKYGIDFCCGGQKGLGEACAEKGLSTGQVLQELAQAAQSTGGPGENYDQWELDFLADYIINQYHTYTKSVLPRVTEFAKKVVEAHGDRHPETLLIAQSWRELGEEMIAHLQKEEQVLFPYIKRIVQGKKEGWPPFGSARQIIQNMEAEHEAVGESLAEIESLSQGFTPPQDACNTYRALYGYLAEFDQATKKHVHLENNILFPKAISLEKQHLGYGMGIWHLKTAF
jgi:regulator of cell morphogenesis and NO signaling